jgi:3-deoxy-D-manno-octulosonate 8-phosphate phosphatase (KDO 8-P phosphatase)
MAFSPTASFGFFPLRPAYNRRRTHATKHQDEGGFGLLSQTMIEGKGFNGHDGTAFSMLRLGGIKTDLITKRISATVALRAGELKMIMSTRAFRTSSLVFEGILKKETIKASEAAFVGDDVIDLPVMRKCGLAIAVANARRKVRKEAHDITEHCGGHGAARDAVE